MRIIGGRYRSKNKYKNHLKCPTCGVPKGAPCLGVTFMTFGKIVNPHKKRPTDE